MGHLEKNNWVDRVALFLLILSGWVVLMTLGS